jgi:(p)ppGpp synthase/HD superfamily hydrolase
MVMKSIIEIAREYATSAHEETNHKYDGKPYSYHLEQVFLIARGYANLIPSDYWDTIAAACWCHDIIEDARQTYNDVKNAVGKDVAEMVFALTNEKGRYRGDRANDKYYQGILDCPFASFVKICDRIANVRQCVETGSKMIEMYQKEQNNFWDKLYCRAYEPMFRELESLLFTPKSTTCY